MKAVGMIQPARMSSIATSIMLLWPWTLLLLASHVFVPADATKSLRNGVDEITLVDHEHLRRVTEQPPEEVTISNMDLKNLFLEEIHRDIFDAGGEPGNATEVVAAVLERVLLMFPDANDTDTDWMDTFLLSDTEESWEVIQAMAAIYGDDSCESLMEPRCREPGIDYGEVIRGFFISTLQQLQSGTVMPDLDTMYGTLNDTVGIDEDFAEYVIEVRFFSLRYDTGCVLSGFGLSLCS